MDTFTVNVVVALPEDTGAADPMDEFTDAGAARIEPGGGGVEDPETGAAGTFGDGGAAPGAAGAKGEAEIYTGENIYD